MAESTILRFVFSLVSLLCTPYLDAQVLAFSQTYHVALDRYNTEHSIFVEQRTKNVAMTNGEEISAAAAPSGTLTSEESNNVDDNDVRRRTSWEPEIASLIRTRINDSSYSRNDSFLVAIVGVPGSGKSTSTTLLSTLLSEGGVENTILPMDGYHLPLSHLRRLDGDRASSRTADSYVYRRGAPDTFAAETLREDLDRVRNGDEPTVSVPGFDHAVGDPRPDAHVFRRGVHRVVLCEGLYLLHWWRDDDDDDDDDDVRPLFDLSVFLEVDSLDACVDRLKIRNRCIPGYTPEEIDVRCEVVDRVNALTVLDSQRYADVTVRSIVNDA